MNYLIKLTTLCSLTLVLGVSLAEENSDAEPAATESAALGQQADNVPAEQVASGDKSAIMYVPLDGRSIESFTAGLEKVDQEATEQEYRDLMSSLDFLLFYDIGARRDKARLYSRLNGKSPEQILEKVAKTRNNNK